MRSGAITPRVKKIKLFRNRKALQQFIYFHRHGQTSYSMQNRGYGNDEQRAMLTPRGAQEAELLGQELAKHGQFDLYLTSPLPRAVQTATLVHRYLGNVEFRGEPALREPMGDAPKEVWKRATDLIKELNRTNHQRILLSTHGYLFYCFCTYFRGLELNELKNFVNPPTGAYAWVELNDGKLVQAAWECKAHLKPLDTPAEVAII